MFAVARFILFESKLSRHGPHYEEVAAFPLQ
jgi:2'-5' RNA ligase